MHQTTLRFGPELWAQLEEAARTAGISIAQYVREAAIVRLARGYRDPQAEFSDSDDEAPAMPEAAADEALLARAASQREIDSSRALWNQSRQARARARQLRDEVTRRRVDPS
jgi:hypothetical protein